MDEYLTLDEVQQRLGVAKSTITLMIRDGRLTPHERPIDRRRRYFLREEVERLKTPRVISQGGERKVG